MFGRRSPATDLDNGTVSDVAGTAPAAPRHSGGPGGHPQPRRRTLWLVLGLALAVRLAFLALAIGDEGQLTTIADADEYTALAHDLGQGYGDSDGALFDAGLRRPPLYPVVLWAALAIGGNSLVAAMVPFVLLSVATVFLTHQLALERFGPRPAIWAALLLAVDPISIVWSTYPQPEVLFGFLLTAAVLLLVRAVDRRSLPLAALGGVLVGASALARPISLYLSPLLALIVLALVWRPRPRAVAMAAAVLIPAVALTGSWILRNDATSGVPVFSTIEGKNLLFFRAAGTLAESEGISIAKARARLRTEQERRSPPTDNEAERSKVQREIAVEVIRDHPLGYPPMALKGAGRLLIGPGRAALVNRVTGSDDGGRVGDGLTVAAWALLLVTFGITVVGTVVCLRRPVRTWVLPLLVAVYLVVASAGADAYSRFRYPVMPFIAMLGGLGAAALMDRGKRTKQPEQSVPVPASPPPAPAI